MSRYRFGASRFASACGYGDQSRTEMWRIKTGRKEQHVNEYMQWGQRMESRAIAELQSMMTLKFDCTGEEQVGLTSPRGEYDLICYPDGIGKLEKGEFGVEVKCPKNLTDDVPLKHQLQICGYFLTFEPQVVLYSQWQERECRAWWVHRNKETERIMLPWLDKFYFYVTWDIEPPSFRTEKKPELPELVTQRIF